MIRYIVKRLLIMIPILIGIIFITFFLLNVVPGNPVALMMKEKVNAQVLANLTERMHLNDPWYIRFLAYMGGLFKGDMGVSYKLNRDVSTLIATAFPHTVKLTIASLIVSWLIGIPAGIASAVKKGSALDNTLMTFSLCGISVPAFWVGLLFQYIFGYKLGVLPISGFDSFASIIMPAFCLGWASSGSIARMTRTNLLEVMKNDYIRTARSKGLRESSIVLFHALKNSMMPVVTMMAVQVSGLLSGAVITETVFSIPGLGRISVNAIQNRDMPLLQGTVIFAGMLIMVGNLLADIAYSLLDPRIRVS
jgi:ABC-type dipeptide/oligopeptide/nickel transport systems, permease components